MVGWHVVNTYSTLGFSKDEAIVGDLVQLNDAGVVGIEEQEPLACVRGAVWGMLYADDARIVSKSVEGHAG